MKYTTILPTRLAVVNEEIVTRKRDMFRTNEMKICFLFHMQAISMLYRQLSYTTGCTSRKNRGSCPKQTRGLVWQQRKIIYEQKKSPSFVLQSPPQFSRSQNPAVPLFPFCPLCFASRGTVLDQIIVPPRFGGELLRGVSPINRDDKEKRDDRALGVVKK